MRMRMLARFDFYEPGGTTLITTCRGIHLPLTSEYKGLEVPSAEIKVTRIFFVQFDLSSAVALADEIHVSVGDTAKVYIITGMKAFPYHTEFVAREQGSVASASTETGIVSVWHFGDSGDLGNDTQGANPLTEINTPTYTSESGPNSSPQDGSADLERGTSERFEINDADQQGLDITGSITICCRVKLESIPSAATLVAKGDSVADHAYELWIDSTGTVRIGLSNDGTNKTTAIGATALSTATWYSIAAVYNGADIRIYVDGVLDSNGTQNPKAYTSGIFNSNQKFTIGARSDAVNHYDGLIDDVRIYNVAKSAAEISTWHSTGTT